MKTIDSIEFFAANGGLAVIVLCKPLATVSLLEITAYSETDFIADLPAVPVIEDNAYLSFLGKVSGSVSAAAIYGELHTVWN